MDPIGRSRVPALGGFDAGGPALGVFRRRLVLCTRGDDSSSQLAESLSPTCDPTIGGLTSSRRVCTVTVASIGDATLISEAAEEGGSRKPGNETPLSGGENCVLRDSVWTGVPPRGSSGEEIALPCDVGDS
ncbi:hypothetical protein LTS16_027095, partial [Friedmanniomyces endolithicus]